MKKQKGREAFSPHIFMLLPQQEVNAYPTSQWPPPLSIHSAHSPTPTFTWGIRNRHCVPFQPQHGCTKTVKHWQVWVLVYLHTRVQKASYPISRLLDSQKYESSHIWQHWDEALFMQYKHTHSMHTWGHTHTYTHKQECVFWWEDSWR